MRQTSTFWCLLVTAGCLGLLLGVALGAPERASPAEPTRQEVTQSLARCGPSAPSSAQTARSRFKVMKLFEFSKYKQMFSKTYGSIVEELARQKNFMARAFRSLVSALKYKRGESSFYLSLNQLSDQSPSELEAMSNRELLEASRRSAGDPLGAVLGGAEMNFTQIVETEAGSGGQSSSSISKLLPRKWRGKTTADEDPKATVAGPYRTMDWEMFLPNGENSRSTAASSSSGDACKPHEPDEVFFDHTTAGCMLRPRSQHKCGSCYAFATITYFEWLHCKKTLNLVPFSEQFLIDCGKDRLVSGCGGGSISKAGEFVMNFGLELRSNYGYKKRETTCPYEPEAPLKSTGQFKVSGLEFGSAVSMDQWHKHVKWAPMLILMSTRGQPSFQEYGGGVYDGATCDPNETDHIMLLVGHGREDGHEYWLLRNSYSSSWGEEGHMKLSKRASCIHPSVGFMFGTRDGGRNLLARPLNNKSHDKERIKERYTDGLARSLETWNI